MAHNDQASGSGGGGSSKSYLRKDEAAFFHLHRIPVSPGMRLPSGSGWQLSALGFAVPPLPTGARFRDLVDLRHRQLNPERLADPEYAADNPNWTTMLEAERQAAVDDHEGAVRPHQNNAAWKRHWWEGRDFDGVMREYGYVAPIDRAASFWQMPPSSSSSSSSSMRSTPTTFVEPPPITNSGRRIKTEPRWSAPPPRTGGVTVRDFGLPPPPVPRAAVEVKLEPGASSSRGKKRAAPAAPAPLREEEAEAMFQRDLAISAKLSFDTVQPASKEFAERWSCEDLDIVVLDDGDDEAQKKNSAMMPAAAVKEEVKEEEPPQEPPAWNVDDAVAAFDWDQFYGHWTGR